MVPGLAYQFLDLIGMGHIRNEWVDLFVLVGLIAFMGILGNTVGYWTGRKVGPAMYQWRDRFLFKNVTCTRRMIFMKSMEGLL